MPSLPNPFSPNLLVLFMGAAVIAWSVSELKSMQSELAVALTTVLQLAHLQQNSGNSAPSSQKPIAYIDGHGENPENGYMMHIFEVFRMMGYEVITGKPTPGTYWDVMWTHEYPWTNEIYSAHVGMAGSDQIINHVPGSGYYTSKVALATANTTFGVPQAFQLPDKKEKFLKIAKENPDWLWVQKDNAHRNIVIKPLEELDFDKKESFIQKFVANPFLIDNRKFDIGIYTVITSINPLRVYVYDEYLIRKIGKDPRKVWADIRRTIAEVFHHQQLKMLSSIEFMPVKARFFELSRFDFILDEDLNVYLMEANMSPNLSSGHFKQNQVLYEQVLQNILSLAGVGSHLELQAQRYLRSRGGLLNSEVSDRDLSLDFVECGEAKCEKCDGDPICRLCAQCIDDKMISALRETEREHLSRRNMVRIDFSSKNEKNTAEDLLLHHWLLKKCEQRADWCNV
ncbi:unnamed protein product, partial [Mesorhabditis spiculigera]